MSYWYLELLDHKSQNDLSLLGTMDHRLEQLTSIQLEIHFDAAATNSPTNSMSFCLHQLLELLQSPPAIRSYYSLKLQLAALFFYA
jgi:hypothetical protein